MRSTGLLVLAPLAIERLALRGEPGIHVVRTGMGRERAQRAAGAALASDARAIAVAGLCAAIDPGLRPGDVVCATELLPDGGEPIAVPGSALLAAALRRRGLRVHVGAIASSARIEGPAERRARAGTALALDMESGWLAPAAGDRPLAVLRVVVDADGRRLADPRIAGAGVRALRSLRTARGALAEWGAAVGPRSLALAGPRSFCAGVERAIGIAELALARRDAPVSVRKQIVHNDHVVAELERELSIA